MNFELGDEQRQLKDSLERLLGDQYRFDERRRIAAGSQGFSPSVWRSMTDLGLAGLIVPEAHGGFGGNAMDVLPVMQALGRALVLEPFLASCVLAATAARLAGTERQRAELLPSLASGDQLLCWAHDEAGARHAACWTDTRARPVGGRWVLDGAKINVLHGGSAALLIVSARVFGEPTLKGGRALFLVDAKAEGLSRRDYRLVDDSPASELHLQAVAAVPLGETSGGMLDAVQAEAAITGTLNAGIAAVCADIAGSMQAALDLTSGYLNTRRQFGRLIGENQALRHRAAEMLVSVQTVKSMAIAAAVAAARPDEPESARDLIRAKLLAGRHGRSACEAAIQLHGGIGTTEEYAVSHYLRRVHVMDQLFGDSEAQAVRLAELLG